MPNAKPPKTAQVAERVGSRLSLQLTSLPWDCVEEASALGIVGMVAG